MNVIRSCGIAAVLLACSLPLTAYATNGMFLMAETPQQLAMGGAGVAMVEDAGVATINPAGAVWAGSQLDVTLSLFVGERYYEAGPTGPGANSGILEITSTNGAVKSHHTHFYFPTVAYNVMLDDASSVGITLIAHGGMLMSFKNAGTVTFGKNLPLGLTGSSALGGALPLFQTTCEGTFGGGSPSPGSGDLLGFCGGGDPNASINLQQMFIAPYYSRKITSTFSIGIEPVLAVERFKAVGLAAFKKFSNHPDELSRRGYSYAIGGGVRVGFLWEALPGVGIGGAYESRIYMTRFHKYTGLFPDNGSFDIPSEFSIGFQLHPWPAHRFIFDFQRMYNSDIPAIGNRLDPNRFVNQCAVPRLLYQLTGGAEGSNGPNPACLGAKSGPGFGWRDMSIFKFGYQYQHRRLKLRLGFSFTEQPVPSSQVLFNMLAPGIIERHITGGFAYRLSHAVTCAVSFAYAFSSSVYGRNPLSNAPGHVTVGQNGNLVGLAFDAGTDANDQKIHLNLREFRLMVGFAYRFD